MQTAIGVAGVAVLLWLVLTFNSLVRSRNQVKAGWSDVDVQLQRRHDLIPQLVGAVQGYAKHERSLLEAVATMRSRAMAETSRAKLADIEQQLERQLVQVVALHESYPDLKANTGFLQLQRDLVEVENTLQHARRYYNGAVRELNNAIEVFPAVLVARSFGFQAAEFFEASDREAPVVGGFQ